jgi:multiple sugar transport system ATP-binding protein
VAALVAGRREIEGEKWMSSVQIRDVRKSFGQFEVLHGVSIPIDDGEFVVLVGPSGCGKSTLLRMLAGLENITSGTISIGDRVVNNVQPKERDIAMVFQNYALYPHMTVADNMGFSLKLRGAKPEEISNGVKRAAEILALTPLLERYPRQLSGGQRQRVAMGRAIVREPSVFLFDEPLSNLDAKLRGQMRVEIRRLHRRLKATSIFVTHDQVEAMTLADRLVVMNLGKVEQVGPPEEVYRRPASRFVAGFIGSPPMNFVTAHLHTPDLLEFADGSKLRIPAALSRSSTIKEIVVGIRPEDVRLAASSDYDALTFAIDMVEELGAGRIFYGRLAGADFTIALPSGDISPVDGTLSIRIPAESIHFFDADTGARISSREH